MLAKTWLGRSEPGVPVMKATQPRRPDHLMWWRRPRLNGSSIRSIFVEEIVNSVLVMIGDVIADEPAQMAFARRDDVIKNLVRCRLSAPRPRFAKVLRRSCAWVSDLCH